MNEILSAAVLHLLGSDQINDADYEHCAHLLRQANATSFTVANGKRTIELRGAELFVSEATVLCWPKCIACRKQRNSARYRGDIGARLCGECYADWRDRQQRAARQFDRRA